MADTLPSDVEKVLTYIARTAGAYRNRLQSHEVAKLKSDMMRVPHRWTPDRAPVRVVRAKCLELGMTEADTETVIDLLSKTQAGRRLVPNRFYRDFQFNHPVE